MHMPLADSVFGRGIQRIAGMLAAKAGLDAKSDRRRQSDFHLVSWQPGARSRREDELARARQQMLSGAVEP